MFIDIKVNDNLPFTKLGVHRVHPVKYPPNEGTMCSYDIYKFTYDMNFETQHEKIGSLKFPYGDGNLLAIEVLKLFTEQCAVSSTERT